MQIPESMYQTMPHGTATTIQDSTLWNTEQFRDMVQYQQEK